MTIINVFRHIVRHSKVCLCIVHDSLIALAHQVADPAKGDDGEDTSFGLRAHLLAVHKLPVCQHLQSQSCSLQSKVSQISHFSQVRKHVSAFLQNNMGPHIFLVVIGSFKSVCYGCHSHNCSHPACVISCLQPWLNACFDSWQIFLDSTSCSRHGHTAFWPVYTIQYALFWPHVSIRAPPTDAVH